MDDTPLCGVLNGPCRQSALGALRSDIARDEMHIERDKVCFRVLVDALAAADQVYDEDRPETKRHLESLRTRINMFTDRLAVNRALEDWLADNEKSMSRDADEALWRYITRTPNGGF